MTSRDFGIKQQDSCWYVRYTHQNITDSWQLEKFYQENHKAEARKESANKDEPVQRVNAV